MPGSDTALTVDRTYSDPGRHHRCKSRVRARVGRRGGASLRGGRGPARLGGSAPWNPSPASPGREGPGKTCGPGTLSHRWNRRLASPIPRRCRPALLPARERTLPAGSPGLPGSGSLPAQPPAGLCLAAASPVWQPSPLHDAPPTCCLDQKSISHGRSGVGSRAERAPSPRFAA